MEVTDLEDNVIEVGDRVAGAFRIGNIAVLRTGTVQGFGERGNNITVRVEWDHDSEYERYRHMYNDPYTNVHGGIEADLKRFVKIS